ncbi:hypothetical protein BDQ94DRAFT_140022 [Aspergillus welwitschiae]|uniref:Uncharacterized protein n=1 Tax=Aspergillus welwitschiae TaxID=1341132 RepID=A0A3F3Q942_9EURO|nr:hypothetical protein BDQ94DRAFT_140022 [Aspergillus welwitschiae]RDH35659.1 hypothetical protein BDQ94DRAFT_140022 [Aspergillus welwitschiae]
MRGHCRRCKAGVVCTLGIVEMLVGGFAHDPRPTAIVLVGMLARLTASSLLIWTRLAAVEEFDDRGDWPMGSANFD